MEEDGSWMLGNSREAGMAQHLIIHWLMEDSTENYKLRQPAVFQRDGFVVVLSNNHSGGPAIPLWDPAIVSNLLPRVQLLLIESLLVLFPWGSIYKR